MRLWTVQPLKVWEEMQRKGYFICDSNKSDLIQHYKSFRDSYDWLVLEMEKRIGKRPKGVKYPIWAWHTRDWQRKKPDLRKSEYGNKGEVYVCLEVEKKDNEVVLTDFDAWHFVLNNSFLDDSLSEEEWDRNREWFDSLPNSQKDGLRKKSWQNIFNISPFKNDWMQRGRYIQATFWCIYLEEVKRVQIFKAR